MTDFGTVPCGSEHVADLKRTAKHKKGCLDNFCKCVCVIRVSGNQKDGGCHKGT